MRRLHPATVIVVLLPKLREAIQTSIPVIIGSCATGHDANHEWIAILIAVFTGVFAISAYWTTRYDIQSNHVVLQTGWIFRKDRRIPLPQIQNVNLRQNVLERLFKVATVDVETAMGKGRDLRLSVLNLHDAELFREELLHAAHLDLAGTASQTQTPLIRLNHHDLLLGALTENHLGQMIVLAATLWGPILGSAGRFAGRLPVGIQDFAFPAALVLLVVISWGWGAVSYYLKYGGFEVKRNENAFRISYGLLNKVQLVIRPRRIEYLRITTTLPQRWMGRSSFHVGTASSFGEAGVFAPVALFVETDRAYESAAGVIPGLNIAALQWRPFDPIFYRTAASRGLLALGVLAAIGYWVGAGVARDICVGVAFLAVLNLLGLVLARPENGFAITEDALVVRSGYFHQSIAAMPIIRIENLGVTQPWWWQRYGSVRLSVQAMRRSMRVRALPEAGARELESRWKEKIDSEENRKLYEAVQQVEEEKVVERALESSLAGAEADSQSVIST